jgi:hypothetical protein
MFILFGFGAGPLLAAVHNFLWCAFAFSVAPVFRQGFCRMRGEKLAISRHKTAEERQVREFRRAFRIQWSWVSFNPDGITFQVQYSHCGGGMLF